MKEISNTIYDFKKVMKQILVMKKYSEFAKTNTENLRRGKKIVINPNIVENNTSIVVRIVENNTSIVENKAVKKQRNTPWVCECGASLLWGGRNLHITTKKHLAYVKNIQVSTITLQEFLQIPEVIQVCTVIPEEVIVPKKIVRKVIKKVIKPKPIDELNN